MRDSSRKGEGDSPSALVPNNEKGEKTKRLLQNSLFASTMNLLLILKIKTHGEQCVWQWYEQEPQVVLALKAENKWPAHTARNKVASPKISWLSAKREFLKNEEGWEQIIVLSLLIYYSIQDCI